MPERLPDQIGPFRIQRLLGQGGMARVYLAADEAGVRYAVKWLHRATTRRMEACFADEVAWLNRLDHPGVVRYRGHGTWEGRPWVAMDFVEGTDLRTYADKLRQRPPGERQVRAREIARSLCDALAYVHAQGLIHRDVKPSNVLLSGRGRVLLTDFGVACASDAAPVTAVGMLVGTAAYAAPEQLAGVAIDARVDQYGLGCTLFYLLTGRRPFEEEATAALLQAHLERPPRRPSALDPTIDPELEAFVLRLMAKDPDARFADMEEAGRAIGEARPAGLPLAGRQAVIDTVAAAVERVARGEGVVLHVVGARGSGRGWVGSLAREASDRRDLACIVTDEPEALAAAVGRVSAGEALLVATTRLVAACVTEVRLDPLTVADLRRSTYSFAPATADLARVAERLHRESGGNAGLFLQLLARYRVGDAIVLPDAPLDADAALWIDGMGLDEGAVAGTLAILREPADLRRLEAISMVPPEEVLPALEARGVAARTGEAWVLAAEALRGPLREMLVDLDVLEDRARVDAGETRQVAPQDPLLADLAGMAAAEAEARLRAAIVDHPDDPSTPRRALALGSLLWNAGDVVRARAAYDDALRMAPSASQRARACVGIGISALQAGDVPAALDHLARAVTESTLTGEGDRAVVAMLDLSEARALAGELAEAQRLARRALGMAQGLRDRELECTALRHLGQVLLDLGQPVEAGHRLADASALARAADLAGERLAAHVLRARATLEERPNNRTAAAAALDRLLPLLTDPLGDPARGQPRDKDPEGFRVLVRCTWALAAAVLGDTRMFLRAIAEADPALAGQRLSVRLRAEILLARAAFAANDIGDARARARRVEEEARSHGFALLEWEAARLVARTGTGPLPGAGELANGLEPADAAALERRG